MIVLDASAAIALLLGTDGAEAVRIEIGTREQTLHAPHLLDVEVMQVLRRYCLFEGLAVERCEAALRDLADLELQRYEHHDMLQRIWDLRANMTAYDATYVALAEALGAPLITLDARLARASGHAAHIRLVRA